MEEYSKTSHEHESMRKAEQEVPLVRLRDNIFTKKFGSSPFDSDRY